MADPQPAYRRAVRVVDVGSAALLAAILGLTRRSRSPKQVKQDGTRGKGQKNQGGSRKPFRTNEH
jgi:hypothetical protein